jgi:23S rRNA (uracil1939-C5)-methyltransferase
VCEAFHLRNRISTAKSGLNECLYSLPYYFCPMPKKNVVLNNITVENYAAGGKSLSKVNGKVIFIEGAIPGDVVDVRLSKNKKDWAEGKAVAFHQYASHREIPFCSHFGYCGGCKWQMLPYPLQLQYKQQEVIDNLTRLGKIELPASLPIIGCNNTQQYRNKLEFTFSSRRFFTEPPTDTQGENNVTTTNVLGFHVPRLFDKVLDINTCYLMEEPTNAIKNTIRSYALQQGCSFYDIRNHTGWLRTLVIRVCTTNEVMVNLCLAYDDAPERNKLLQHLLNKVPSITTLLYTINPKKNDSLHDLHPQIYHGKGFVIEKLNHFSFAIGPKSFFQTNTQQAIKLYEVVSNFAELTPTNTVYDLYCGTGSIGIFLSGQAKKIIGIELIAEAIEDAKKNATLNNVHHASFFTGDVVDICTPAFFEEQGSADVIVTDPPRAGMHEKLVQKILNMAAPTVVYVSCNPATQARDIQLLDAKYSVAQIQPVDMFPHTHHIENVVQLKLR